jgi:amidase
MKRRKFFQLGAVGAAAAMVPLSACSQPADPQAAPAQSGAFQDDFSLKEKTVEELQQGMESGTYTAEGLVKQYIERIEQLNPRLHAVIEVNPEALQIASALDAERKEGKVRGPLHGIPVLIKDNIDTADQMMTTAGSLALSGSSPSQDSWVAQKLREAGAIILGKTNLSEWANFRSSRSSSGWSGRGGQTRNPYILDRSPCGSSSGSGSAASGNLSALTIGTETNGSIVCPSSTNGIVGIKPTVGLVGRSGIIPISHSQDTAGPMTRTVQDAAILLGALTGVDPRDEATQASQGKSHSDYTIFLDKKGLQGARIGIGKQFFGFHEKVDALMEQAIEDMKAQGAELIELERVTPRDRELGSASYNVLLYEFKAGINAYLASLGTKASAKNLDELIAYNEANAEKEMPFFQQEIFTAAAEKGDLNSEEYKEALALTHRLNREEGIDKVMSENQLDAIIGPTGGPAWPIDVINGDHFGGGSSSPAARAGYPNITVPAGFIHGLPVGISFFGRAWSEPTLIRIAYAYEQATGHRKPPAFLPTLPYE